MSTIDTTFQPGNRTPVRDASTQGDYAQQQFTAGWRLHLDTQRERATWRSPWTPTRLRLPWGRAKRIAHQHAPEWGHRILRDGNALDEPPEISVPKPDARIQNPPEILTTPEITTRWGIAHHTVSSARRQGVIRTTEPEIRDDGTLATKTGASPYAYAYILDRDFYAWLDGCRVRRSEPQTTRDGLEVIPTREVLRRFPVSEKQLVNARSTGRITAQKVGNRWRYVIDERFRAWVKACHRRKAEATIERTRQAMQQAEREAGPPRLIPGDGMPDPQTLDLFAREVRP